jgi:Flp pilus assembly protein TadG
MTLCRHASWRRWLGDDRGAISLYAVVMFVVLLLAAGLVVDGGAKLLAARQAATLAEEAARDGAEQVNIQHAYQDGGPLVVNPSAAAAAASNWLAAAGHPGTASVSGADSITVSVTVIEPTIILSLIGIDSVSGSATATAFLSQGITTEIGGFANSEGLAGMNPRVVSPGG